MKSVAVNVEPFILAFQVLDFARAKKLHMLSAIKNAKPILAEEHVALFKAHYSSLAMDQVRGSQNPYQQRSILPC